MLRPSAIVRRSSETGRLVAALWRSLLGHAASHDLDTYCGAIHALRKGLAYNRALTTQVTARLTDICKTTEAAPSAPTIPLDIEYSRSVALVSAEGEENEKGNGATTQRSYFTDRACFLGDMRSSA